VSWSAESGSYLVSVATRSLEAASNVQVLAEALRGPEAVFRQAGPGRPGWFAVQCWLAPSEWTRAEAMACESSDDALVGVDELAGRLRLGLFGPSGVQRTSIARTSLRPLRNQVTGEPLFGPAPAAESWPLARDKIDVWLADVGNPRRGGRTGVLDELDRYAAWAESGMAEEFMQAVGLISSGGADALRQWRGAVGYWSFPRPPRVGRRRVNMGCQAWFAGQTAHGIAPWSRDHGPDPVETATPSLESTARFTRAVHEQVIMPELRATVLDGRRYWSTYQPPASADGTPAERVYRLVAHISPLGALAVFVAVPKEVATAQTYAPGQPLLVDRLWPTVGRDGTQRQVSVVDLLPGGNDTELLQVASLTYPGGDTGDWHPVPDETAPTLIATCAFARTA
jgi:hypothetical protein